MNLSNLWGNIEFILPSLALLGIYVLVAILFLNLFKWLKKKNK